MALEYHNISKSKSASNLNSSERSRASSIQTDIVEIPETESTLPKTHRKRSGDSAETNRRTWKRVRAESGESEDELEENISEEESLTDEQIAELREKADRYEHKKSIARKNSKAYRERKPTKSFYDAQNLYLLLGFYDRIKKQRKAAYKAVKHQYLAEREEHQKAIAHRQQAHKAALAKIGRLNARTRKELGVTFV